MTPTQRATHWRSRAIEAEAALAKMARVRVALSIVVDELRRLRDVVDEVDLASIEDVLEKARKAVTP